MHISKAFATVTLLASAFHGTAATAETRAAFYLAYSPGTSVQYLSLNESGSEVSGFLEAVRPSTQTADGQTCVQTFATGYGNSLSFGAYDATRTSNGYTLTTMTPDGKVDQVRFVRSTARLVNASIVALAASVNRNRTDADRISSNRELEADGALSAADAAQLDKAQLAGDSAAALLGAAQAKADRLSTSARKARVEANAALDETGVSLTQNQSRMAIMKLADEAEHNVRVAQHAAELDATDMETARATVTFLRIRIADIAARDRDVKARLANGGTASP